MVEPNPALNAVPDEPELPTEITVDPNNPIPPHNARDVALLKAETGRTFTELMGEGAEDADRLAVTVWLHLRRQGFTPTLDQAAEVFIRYTGATVDPTPPAPSMMLPDSVDFGGASPETSTT